MTDPWLFDRLPLIVPFKARACQRNLGIFLLAVMNAARFSGPTSLSLAVAYITDYNLTNYVLYLR